MQDGWIQESIIRTPMWEAGAEYQPKTIELAIGTYSITVGDLPGGGVRVVRVFTYR